MTAVSRSDASEFGMTTVSGPGRREFGMTMVSGIGASELGVTRFRRAVATLTRIRKRTSELAFHAEGEAAGAEADAEAAGLGVAGAGVEQLRGDAERAAEQVGVRAVEAGEARQRGERAGTGGVGEGDLILRREAGLVLSLGAREGVEQLAVAGGVVRACGAVGGVLRERVEGRGQRRLRWRW